MAAWRVVGLRRALLLGAVVAVLALHLGGAGGGAAQARGRIPKRIAPKLLTVTMFQEGDPLHGGSGEATVWVQNDHLDQVVPIPGSYSPSTARRASSTAS